MRAGHGNCTLYMIHCVAVILEVERDGIEPMYLQVARQVREAIADGRLEAGSGLPSVRTLAADLGVNLNTVARAYRLLEDEGFLEIRHGRGVRVQAPAARPDRAARDRLLDDLRVVLVRLRQVGLSPDELRRVVEREIGALGTGGKEAGS